MNDEPWRVEFDQRCRQVAPECGTFEEFVRALLLPDVVCGNCGRALTDDDFPSCAVAGIDGSPEAAPVVLCGACLGGAVA